MRRQRKLGGHGVSVGTCFRRSSRERSHSPSEPDSRSRAVSRRGACSRCSRGSAAAPASPRSALAAESALHGSSPRSIRRCRSSRSSSTRPRAAESAKLLAADENATVLTGTGRRCSRERRARGRARPRGGTVFVEGRRGERTDRRAGGRAHRHGGAAGHVGGSGRTRTADSGGHSPSRSLRALSQQNQVVFNGRYELHRRLARGGWPRCTWRATSCSTARWRSRSFPRPGDRRRRSSSGSAGRRRRPPTSATPTSSACSTGARPTARTSSSWSTSRA